MSDGCATATSPCSAVEACGTHSTNYCCMPAADQQHPNSRNCAGCIMQHNVCAAIDTSWQLPGHAARPSPTVAQHVQPHSVPTNCERTDFCSNCSKVLAASLRLAVQRAQARAHVPLHSTMVKVALAYSCCAPFSAYTATLFLLLFSTHRNTKVFT
jgi:hypothetical protein